MLQIFTLVAGLCSLLGVSPQCLSFNDDLSLAADTDLSLIQDFHFDLFKRVIPKDPSRNFIFSPYSVWNTLVLAYLGSGGETTRQFEQVLRVQDKISTLRKWRQLEYMYSRRPETSINNTFVLSNRIYFDTSVKIRLCIEDILHNEVKQLNLLEDPTTSAASINRFVAETTRGHITQLVSPSDIMLAHMVLVNAAFFKGFWSSTFDPKNTRNMPFRKFNSQTVQVPMMTQYGLFHYGFDDKNKYEVLALPYVGDVIFMYIFLPYTEKKSDFDTMLHSFDSNSIDNLLKNLWETKMHIFVPRFSLDSVLEDDLLQAIYNMGLKDAFVVNKANFTEFSYNRLLKLDRGIHKAFIDVNEEGTEAGAATAFIANKIGSSRFICDRPFVFVIRDSQVKNILFMGAYREPKALEEDSSVKVPPGSLSVADTHPDTDNLGVPSRDTVLGGVHETVGGQRVPELHVPLSEVPRPDTLSPDYPVIDTSGTGKEGIDVPTEDTYDQDYPIPKDTLDLNHEETGSFNADVPNYDYSQDSYPRRSYTNRRTSLSGTPTLGIPAGVKG